VRKVASGGIDPAWTPDGQSLVIATNREGEDRGIFVQRLEGGTRRQLTRPPMGFLDSYPKVSPDGKTLAFGRSSGLKKNAMFVMPMSGGEPVRLTDDVGVGRFDWTPDGREILYPQVDTSGLRVFRIVASPGQRATAVPDIPIGVNMLSVSPMRTGQAFRVALGWGQSDVGLRLVDLDAVTPAGVFALATPFCDATRIDMPGRLSRDGRHVAFASDRNGEPQIWVADRDGSGLRSVSGLADGFENAGSWSPDGRFVAVSGAVRGNTDIFVVSVEGGSGSAQTTGRPGRNRATPGARIDWEAKSPCVTASDTPREGIDRGETNLWKIPNPHLSHPRAACASRDMASWSASGMTTSRISTDETVTPQGFER
jgi:dipeptidyl aminopeptidase/acylaminoacyl peptidase